MSEKTDTNINNNVHLPFQFDEKFPSYKRCYMKRRIVVFMMVACMTASFITACGQKKEKGNASGDPVKKTEVSTLEEKNESDVTDTSEDSDTSEQDNKTDKSLPVKKGSVSYTLEINDVVITTNKVTLNSDHATVSIAERLSDEVIDGKCRGDYVKSGIEKGISDIDIPFKEERSDGTVVTAEVYTLDKIKDGTSFHIRLADDMAKRLGLKSNVITVDVPKF